MHCHSAKGVCAVVTVVLAAAKVTGWLHEVRGTGTSHGAQQVCIVGDINGSRPMRESLRVEKTKTHSYGMSALRLRLSCLKAAWTVHWRLAV